MPWEVPSTGTKAPVTSQVPPSVSAGLNKVASGTAAAGPEKIAEGKEVFQKMQCFTCHVDGGNVINPSKPIKGADFKKKYPDDAQIAKIIRNGVPGTAMPAYGTDRLSDDQMGPLIAYIRSLTP